MLKLEATIEVGDQTKTLLFETEEPVITLGRESKNDFQLPLTTVSRQHCRISVEDEQYFVEDLGSAHGTTLNGQKLAASEKKLLRSGDALEISKARIKVEIIKTQIERAAGEKTEMLAKRAVEDILRGLDAGQAQEEVPYLRIMSGPDEGRTFKFRGPVAECVLGRSRESDLVINDANSSRRHALVKKDYSGVIYQCLGAKNLSVLNGKEVPRNAVKRLRDRDEIAIGAVKILFIDPDAELLKSLSGIPGFEEPADPEPEPAEELPPADDSAVSEPQTDLQADAQNGEAPNEESVAAEAPAEEGSVAEAPGEGEAQEAAESSEEPAAADGAESEAPAEAASEQAVAPAEVKPPRQMMEMVLFGVGALILLIGIVVVVLLLF